MSTSTKAESSVQSAFAGLIDDAGLFPPAALSMEHAVDRYIRARAGEHAWILGRFIVPASRLDELVTVLRRTNAPEPVPLSVIVDSDPHPRRWFGSAQSMLADVSLMRSTVSHVSIEVLEAALPPLATRRETFDASIGQLAALAGQASLRDLAMYVELPRDPRFDELLRLSVAALGRARLGAKLRCGGVSAEAFPGVEEVAAFVTAVSEAAVPFKATAGLHHPVRHLDVANGFVMHGFLNLLAAATFTHRTDAAMLAQIVAEEDPRAFYFDADGFVWRDLRASSEELAAMRRRFVGYGSCSFTEPIADLITLSVLPNPQ